MCSITLHNMHVKEMGIYLAGSLLLPFLKTGLILAVVQSEGLLPVEIDFWNSNWMIGAVSSLNSFMIIGLIPSGPGALSGLRLESNLRIPFMSMLIYAFLDSCIGLV